MKISTFFGHKRDAGMGLNVAWASAPLALWFLLHLQNYKEFEAEILDLQIEKYGLSFDIKKCTTSSWALGDENVISIRSFKVPFAVTGHICFDKLSLHIPRNFSWSICEHSEL